MKKTIVWKRKTVKKGICKRYYRQFESSLWIQILPSPTQSYFYSCGVPVIAKLRLWLNWYQIIVLWISVVLAH